MAIKRLFLGWDRPLCETVPAYLLAGSGAGMLDLRGTVVVVSTRQSSWRLRAALPLAADARGSALLGPEIVTPPVLLTPPPTAAVATSFQSLLAWSAVLKAVKPGELTAFLGAREGRISSTGWALQVARSLQDLRNELADGGLTIADVTRRADIEEGERWSAMADLEGKYVRQLEDWHLRDALCLKLDHARRGILRPDVRRVVVAAVPDPPKLFMALLDKWAAAGGMVEVLVGAPEAEAAVFDAWGRPLPEEWQAREITLRAEDLWLEATPADQAGRIRKAIKDGMGVAPAEAALRPQLAIGVPDRETVAPLQRELAAIGLPAFDPQHRRLADTALFGLVRALMAMRNSPGYAEVAALMRHPDVLASFGRGGDLLRELDEHQSERLPVTLEDMLADLDTKPAASGSAHDSWEDLRPALARIDEWRIALNTSNFAAGLRSVMMAVYKNRILKSDDPTDAAFRQAVTEFDTRLRELEDAVAAGHAEADAANADAAEVLMALLKDAPVKGERRDERLDLEGWLELAWNPAQLLFVAGMNEGFVPDGHVGDVFLPDSLRSNLELRDDKLRVARDAYVLTALIEQRRNEGRVILLVGKTSTAGDPLRPSRLLFRCADKELVTRAQMLFNDPPPSHEAKAFTISFQLDPALLPAGCIDRKRSRELSPTIFRDYLACPLRFYLRHVLGMQPLDDRGLEPDALAFGNLVHEVLYEMGNDGGLRASCDGSALARWLEERLRSLVLTKYGARPWLGVELAMDSAVQRLRTFARKQVEWHKEGWEILSRECEIVKSIQLAGLIVKGRIDRIDRNSGTGKICVLDYKTTDKAKAPRETHFGPPREPDDLTAAGIPAELTGGKKGKRWADLQLPLYRELVRADFGPDVQLGYICLPKALGETGFKIWERYPDALHASAIQCAEAIVKRIKDGEFWPPGQLNAGFNDALDGVLLGDPEKTICRPASPWRAGT